MRTKLSQSIRKARLAAELTQEQLGRRLGLKGRAVYRWECGHSEPKPRHRRAIMLALGAADPGAMAQLEAALEIQPAGVAATAGTADRLAGVSATRTTPEWVKGHAAPAVTLAETRPALAGDGSSLELLLFRMADELDLPPRRMRGASARLLRSMRTEDLSLERAEKELDEWMERVAS